MGVFGWVNHNIMSLQTALAEFFAPPHDATILGPQINVDNIRDVLTQVKAHVDANSSDRQLPLLLLAYAPITEFTDNAFVPMFA